jgi:hypothetical protein
MYATVAGVGAAGVFPIPSLVPEVGALVATLETAAVAQAHQAAHPNLTAAQEAAAEALELVLLVAVAVAWVYLARALTALRVVEVVPGEVMEHRAAVYTVAAVAVATIQGRYWGLTVRLVQFALFGPATSACSQTLELVIFK